MILYDRDNFNCAHYAIGEINRWHDAGINISDGHSWQADFIPYLRKSFKPVKRPVNKCLVVMTTSRGLHLGVYNDYMVHHNYNPSGCAGSVIISDMGTIRSEFKRVRFYVYDKAL